MSSLHSSAIFSVPARLILLCSAALLALLLITPVQASTVLEVSFPRAALEQIAPGDRFSFSLPARDHEDRPYLLPVDAVVISDDYYSNGSRSRGDRVLFIEGSSAGTEQSIRIVLTAGDAAVFADISAGEQRWVLDAWTAGEGVAGVIYQPEALQPLHGQTHDTPADFVIPTPARQQLALNNGEEQISAFAASTESGLEIQQHFSEYAIFVGHRSELEVRLQFRNISAQTLTRVSAEVYFILEDAELISAPACVRAQSNSSPRQPILRCTLAGELAPGASRSLTYRVQVPAKAAPMRLWSTVLAGGQRHDATLNVVNDIVGEGSGKQLYPGQLHDGLVDERGNAEIDVLMLYTPDAEAMYGAATGTRINQLVGVANQIYQDSGVHITLRPVHHARIHYPEADADMYQQLDQLTTGSHPAFAQVSALRQRYGADLVVLMRTMGRRPGQSDMCGLANLGGYQTLGDMMAFNERDYAFSLVALDCPVSSVLAHELGHNMGLTHSHREDGQGGTFPFATGHGVDGVFATVMASPGRFSDAKRVARFSDPSVQCQGLPCGVRRDDSDHGADAVRALNLVRFQIASYLPSRVPMKPARHTGRLDGRATEARIALGASVDQGLSYVQSAAASQRLDITADMYVDPAHVGRQGQFHVLADLSAAGHGMLQLNQQGQLFDWDGSVAALVPFSAPATLNPVEYLRILNDFEPVSELHGFPLVLYLAYQLPDTGEVIYTLEPLVVNIAR